MCERESLCVCVCMEGVWRGVCVHFRMVVGGNGLYDTREIFQRKGYMHTNAHSLTHSLAHSCALNHRAILIRFSP